MMKVRYLLKKLAFDFEMLWIRYFKLKSFYRYLSNPEKSQKTTLANILQRNSRTTFGKKYNFTSIKSEKEFCNQVPIHFYEDLRPYIESQVTSGGLELNSNQPAMYLQTSGTTGKPKYIPLSGDTLKSYRRVQEISSYLQNQTARGVFYGKLLAIVSPRHEGSLDNGVPFGSMSGVISECLPSTVLSKSLVPQEIFNISDYDQRYRLISAIAICSSEITCLASANPLTFLKLNEVINKNIEALLSFLETGETDQLGMILDQGLKEILKHHCQIDKLRAAELRSVLNKQGCIKFSDLWPQLKAIITWTSGNCGLVIPKLLKQFPPEVKVIDLGYLASEFWGTITIDSEKNFGVPTVQDNFFEFIEPEDWDAGNRETVLLRDLKIGKRYYIIVTTQDGLYRYFINDIIEVTGRYINTPSIIFVQKGKGVTSLTGEKLYEGQVIQAVQEVSKLLKIEVDSFIMLADREAFSYTMYVECSDEFEIDKFSSALNDSLCVANVEFEAKLKSGRIRSAGVRRVKLGTFDAYKSSAIKSGQREGQYKSIRLQYCDEVSFAFHEYEC